MSINALPLEQIRIPQVEGEINLIYGPIGGGKNTFATKMMLDDLKAGYVVFSTTPIKFDGTDDLKSFGSILLGLIGMKSRYRQYGKGNFKYISLEEMMDEKFMLRLDGITDAVFYIDEAYAARVLDSYRKTNLSVRERMVIYTTRHVNRKFVIIAQRPNSIHVSSRAMVNRFYKCEQLMPKFLTKLLRFYIFRRTEFQDMIDESVNEDIPYSTSIKIITYGSKIFKVFDSKYMRGDRPILYPPDIKEYKVGYFSRWGLLFKGISFSRKAQLTAPRALSLSPFQQKSIRNIDIKSIKDVK